MYLVRGIFIITIKMLVSYLKIWFADFKHNISKKEKSKICQNFFEC